MYTIVRSDGTFMLEWSPDVSKVMRLLTVLETGDRAHRFRMIGR